MIDAGRRVSLITVLYDSREVVAQCVESATAAAEQAGYALEVILVDNRPGDGAAEAALWVAPGAIVIENTENVGFARACNQSFERATGAWWLLLNPDATLAVDAVGKLVTFMATHGRAGAVAPTLDSPGRNKATNGGMLPGLRSAIGHFWWLNRVLRGDRGGPWRGLLLHRRLDLGPRRVEWVSGGAVLLRPEAVRSVGGFDPAFFLYAEDVDLGRRLTEAGWESWLLPDASGAHSLAASSGGATDRWFVALHDYHAKRAGRLSLAVFDFVAGTGLLVRALVARDPRHRLQMRVSAQAALGLAWRTIRNGPDD
jgi:N-acetylglucosaminyl-diphospho-decaprenol L-rhamnosyltransferase